MGLWERLCGTETPRIPGHPFATALAELERGKMTRQQIIDGLLPVRPNSGVPERPATQEEIDSLDAIVALVRTPQESYPLNGRVTLTNVGAAYDTNLDSQSLPFIYIQKAGVTRLDVELRVRKVGTGNQDWQLWNDTDGNAAIGPGALTTGSLTDSAAAGDHTLSASRTFAQPLSPGVVKLRLRAQSSVAADDPVFLQAALLVFRVDTITPVVLHEIIYAAEWLVRYGVAPYPTVAAVKARLGVP